MNPEAALIVLIVFSCVMSVPLAAIFTHHKRKMAEILHGQGARSIRSDAEARLEHEISELRQLVAQQAIVVDDLSMMHRRLLERSTDDAVRQRLS